MNQIKICMGVVKTETTILASVHNYFGGGLGKSGVVKKVLVTCKEGSKTFQAIKKGS